MTDLSKYASEYRIPIKHSKNRFALIKNFHPDNPDWILLTETKNNGETVPDAEYIGKDNLEEVVKMAKGIGAKL